MEMNNDLSALFSDIENQFVSVELSILRQFFRDENEMRDERFVLPGDLGDRRDVFFRHDENVHRRDRIDIRERDDPLVLEFDRRRTPSRRDFAKNTIGHLGGINSN